MAEVTRAVAFVNQTVDFVMCGSCEELGEPGVFPLVTSQQHHG